MSSRVPRKRGVAAFGAVTPPPAVGRKFKGSWFGIDGVFIRYGVSAVAVLAFAVVSA
ncbi:hypothetical protein BH23DEI1_BH23DEI1_12870 [soil metagenome]